MSTGKLKEGKYTLKPIRFYGKIDAIEGLFLFYTRRGTGSIYKDDW